MSKTFVTGLFKTRAAAEAAVDAIIKRGYTRDDISVFMSDATKNKEFAVEPDRKQPTGLALVGLFEEKLGVDLPQFVALPPQIAKPGGLFVAAPTPPPPPAPAP